MNVKSFTPQFKSVDDDFDLKDKRVVFKPIVIDMLDVVSVSFQFQFGGGGRVSILIPPLFSDSDPRRAR